MRLQNGKVVFEREDMHFLQKFGPAEAIRMAFTHNEPTPFIYDTHQLAALIGISHKELFRLTREVEKLYKECEIPKKSGGIRRICAPQEPLMKVQRAILYKILYCIPVSDHACAYRPGVKLCDNAASHVGKRYLLKLDLTDFFGSIRFDRVYSEVFHTKRFPKQIGSMLTALCCKDDVLPQGAPTSPAISNIVMKHFDDIFGAWCEKRGFSYTRYCDDITVSGNSSLYSAYVKAEQMLAKMNFSINRKKTHFLTNANRQTVTGLTVNAKIGVPADYKRKLRQEVYYACKYGLKDIIENRYPKEFVNVEGELFPYIPQLTPEIMRRETARYHAQLLGKINFVLSVEPENLWFKKAKEQLLYAITPWYDEAEERRNEEQSKKWIDQIVSEMDLEDFRQ